MMILSPLVGYITILMLCVLGTLSVNTLLGHWVCLEVNMLCAIPLLVYTMSEDAILGGVKYFISQSSASLLFVLAVFLSAEFQLAFMLMSLSIFFKLGLPPMQSWLTSMLPSLSYFNLFLIFTVQKIIPFSILSFLSLSPWLFTLASMSAMFFMLSALTQMSSMFMLMFFSSVTNGLWVLSGVYVGSPWFIFMLFYSVILFCMVFSLQALKIFKVSDLSGLPFSEGLLLGLQFLNLGGLPPLVGFLMKLMMMKQLALMSFSMMSLLVVASILMLYIYVTFAQQVYCFNSLNKFSASSSATCYSTLVVLGGSGLFMWFLM